jgi:IclR family mhp operon transcriptional activator
MGEVSKVRALHRGLDILEFLAANGPSGLHRIHVGTGLPKSSLRRLLATLVERRFIRVGLNDGMYRSNIATPLVVNLHESVLIGRLVEVARPHMLKLVEQVKWPNDLHIFANGRMRIIESTHGQSLFAGQNLHVETDLNMFVAASGLAYLACLSDAECLAIMEEYRSDEFASPERYGVTPRALLANLAATRAAGFAERKTSQLRPDNRRAIAVAVRRADGPVGALAIAWPKQLMTADAFAATHLPAIMSAVAAISKEIEARGP